MVRISIEINDVETKCTLFSSGVVATVVLVIYALAITAISIVVLVVSRHYGQIEGLLNIYLGGCACVGGFFDWERPQWLVKTHARRALYSLCALLLYFAQVLSAGLSAAEWFYVPTICLAPFVVGHGVASVVSMFKERVQQQTIADQNARTTSVGASGNVALMRDADVALPAKSDLDFA